MNHGYQMLELEHDISHETVTLKLIAPVLVCHANSRIEAAMQAQGKEYDDHWIIVRAWAE